VTPAPDETLFIRQVLSALGETALYARIDIVRDDHSEPRLLELELIEPNLYFHTNESAASRFVAALKRRLDPIS